MGNAISDPIAPVALQTTLNPQNKNVVDVLCPAYFRFQFNNPNEISNVTKRVVDFMTSFLPDQVQRTISDKVLNMVEVIRITAANQLNISVDVTKEHLLANLKVALDRLDSERITATMSTEDSFGMMLAWALIRDLALVVDANC